MRAGPGALIRAAGVIPLPPSECLIAAYLASPEAGFVTGTTLDVNGGMRMG